MSIFSDFAKWRHERKMQKIEKIRAKNDRLRREGVNPTKGWNKVVNTGSGGLNKVTTETGSGTIDITGNNNETVNFFSEEQKNLGKELDKYQK